MLGEISDWQQQILEGPPEVVVPAAVFVFLILIRVALALPRPIVPELDGLEEEARHWISERIDEHVEDLTAAYVAIGVQAEEDDLPPGFALRIDSFIAGLLQRDLDAKDVDLDLRSAIREFVVLHRAEIYEDVVTRTREHLAVA